MKTQSDPAKTKESVQALYFLCTLAILAVSGWIIIDTGADIFFNALSEFKAQSIIEQL